MSSISKKIIERQTSTDIEATPKQGSKNNRYSTPEAIAMRDSEIGVIAGNVIAAVTTESNDEKKDQKKENGVTAGAAPITEFNFSAEKEKKKSEEKESTKESSTKDSSRTSHTKKLEADITIAPDADLEANCPGPAIIENLYDSCIEKDDIKSEEDGNNGDNNRKDSFSTAFEKRKKKSSKWFRKKTLWILALVSANIIMGIALYILLGFSGLDVGCGENSFSSSMPSLNLFGVNTSSSEAKSAGETIIDPTTGLTRVESALDHTNLKSDDSVLEAAEHVAEDLAEDVAEEFDELKEEVETHSPTCCQTCCAKFCANFVTLRCCLCLYCFAGLSGITAAYIDTTCRLEVPFKAQRFIAYLYGLNILAPCFVPCTYCWCINWIDEVEVKNWEDENKE